MTHGHMRVYITASMYDSNIRMVYMTLMGRKRRADLRKAREEHFLSKAESNLKGWESAVLLISVSQL